MRLIQLTSILFLSINFCVAKTNEVVKIAFKENTNIKTAIKQKSLILYIKESNTELGFNKGDIGYARLDYIQGDFIKRQFIPSIIFPYGYPYLQVEEATIYNSKGQAFVCEFSTKKTKVKALRKLLPVRNYYISGDLVTSAAFTLLDPLSTELGSTIRKFSTKKDYYCFLSKEENHE